MGVESGSQASVLLSHPTNPMSLFPVSHCLQGGSASYPSIRLGSADCKVAVYISGSGVKEGDKRFDGKMLPSASIQLVGLQTARVRIGGRRVSLPLWLP